MVVSPTRNSVVRLLLHRARLLFPLVMIIGMTAVTAATVDAAASPSKSTPPPLIVAPTTTTYTVGGQSVTMVCQGRGRIPVIFQAGGDDPGRLWGSTIANLGPDVLTCVFNRPGVDTSAPSPTPLTPRSIEKTLAAVLKQAHIGARFVLVGHSIGGLNSLVFGSLYPKRVAGAVLFDPSESAFFQATHSESILQNYGYDPNGVYSQIDAVKHWPSVPLVVLSADPAKAVADGQATAEVEKIWEDGAKRYAGLSPKGTRIVVPGATHYVYIDAPQVAVDTIKSVIAKVS